MLHKVGNIVHSTRTWTTPEEEHLVQESNRNSLRMNIMADPEQECANLEDSADNIDIDEEKAA